MKTSSLLAKGSIGLLVVLIATVSAAQPMVLADIARDPIKFDRRMVTVRGVVGLTETGVPRPTFQLIDGAYTIRVVAPPAPPIKPGDRVEVEGMFNFAAYQIDAIRLTWR